MSDTITLSAARLGQHWRSAADRAGAVPALIPMFDGVNRAAVRQLGTSAWNLRPDDGRAVSLPAREGTDLLRLAA